MKKFLIGATTALTTLALAGGHVSAQVDGAYTLPGQATVAGESTCTPVSDPPQLEYVVTYNQSTAGLTLTLSFTAGGAAFGSPVVVPSFQGTIPFPTNGNGSNGGYLADGWSIVAGGLWFDGPSADVDIVATLTDADGAEAVASAAITYDFEGCVAGLPPVTTVPGATPPIPPPTPLAPPTVTPAPPVPPRQAAPLPRTGMSTFESGMRLGALLLIGGLGFVIVAKRRRFAAVTSASS